MESTDVLVIGGGVIGCAVAYELAKAKLSVRLVERGAVGCEASGAAAGMLAPQKEASGDNPFFRLCIEGRALFPAYLHEIKEFTALDVEWHQDGLVAVPLNEEEEQDLESVSRWQRAGGFRVQRLDVAEIRSLEPDAAAPLGSAFYFPDEAHLDNAAYNAALARAASQAGAEIREHEQVNSLLVSHSRIRAARTSLGELACGTVILCAGAWSGKLLPYHPDREPVLPIRGQMLALRAARPVLRRLVWSRAVYAVPRNGGEVLVGATMEQVGFDKGTTAAAISSMLRSILELAPPLGRAEFLRTWAGLRPATADRLPMLGPDPQVVGLIHATGHFRNGILLSAVTGKMIAELVAGGRSRIPAPFDPSRLFGKHSPS